MINQQKFNHLSRHKNWTFTQNDIKAQQILSHIQNQARQDMPHTGLYSIYSPFIMNHYQQMKQHKLYKLMKTIPKGVLHHCHIQCCQDKEYYRKYIINDPITYLNQEMNGFRNGTRKQAQQGKWVSMNQLKDKFQTQEQMVDFVSSITMFTNEDNRKIAAKQIDFWPIFNSKIFSFFEPILNALHHFKTYIKHICQKFIMNGYDRLEFRAMILTLTQYDSQGNVVRKHPQTKYMQVIDEVQTQLKQHHPNFSVGIIFYGLKISTPQQNQQMFTKICQIGWNKTIGFDVIQEQDVYGPLAQYDQVISKVLEKYPHLGYKKVYHAGETKDPLSNNIEIAVRAGSVRIGHGLTIFQRAQFLSQCKDICFQLNPISNIIAGLRDDTRISNAPLLMSLGYALTINPDDPGKFGFQDSTVDYFSAFISYNWSLKQLKLIAIHSINHAICSQQQKKNLLQIFNKKWNTWVIQLIQREMI